MKKLFYIVLLLVSTYVFSQNRGMMYQAVIYAPGGQNLPGYDLAKVPMANRTICLQFSFLDERSSLEYQEEVKIKTDEFGMVNITIGSGNQTGGYASSYDAIAWSAAAEKSLKVALDATGLCSQFDELSVGKLESVPFANAATTAGNVSGIVALANGGTAATTAPGARTNLGLGSVDNTSDVNKPVSTATQTALNAKANTADVTTSLALKANATDVTNSLALKANTADVTTSLALKANSADVTTSLALKANLASPTFTGTVSGIDKTMVGLPNVNNTSDADKPVSTATQTALNAKANTADVTTSLALKANLASPTFTGTVSGIDKTMVGLPNVENTSDVNKPVSTATQTALNAKANTADVTTSLATKADAADVTSSLALKANAADVTTSLALKADIVSPSLTGVPTAPTAASSVNTTQIATTAFVTTATTGKFVDLTTNQTIAGSKTFSADLNVNGLTVGKGLGNISENTAIGENTLSSNTNGAFSVAVGFDALKSNTGGNNNTAIGGSSLNLNTTGSQNTSVGNGSMFSNSTGRDNTAIGSSSMVKNTLGDGNTALGRSSLRENTTGSFNTAIGNLADVGSGTLTNATAIGYGAQVSASNTIQLGADGSRTDIDGNTIPAVTNVKTSGTLTAGDVTYPNAHNSTSGQVLTIDNAGLATWAAAAGGVPYTGATGAVNLGAYDLTVNGITVGKGGGSDSTNTAIGHLALTANTTGINNTANGGAALTANTTGGGNTANGSGALFSNISGSVNTASGAAALYSNTTGDGNTAIGGEALGLNTTGSSNTAIGSGALSTNSTGDFNTAIGYLANVVSDSLTNATAIGNGAIVSASNTIQLGNTAVTAVKTSGAITAGGKIIAGASSASSTSAVMEANSTTQGFLPPRLTTTQRDSIASPVAGLTIWNTTNTQLEVYDGSYWKNMVGLLVSPLQVGDEYGGGKVFYIFGPSDIGFIKGQTHGLIASTSDQSPADGVRWFPGAFYGATATNLGTGIANTALIMVVATVFSTNVTSYAAGLANSCRDGGYVDWFLPSKDELNKLYQQKDLIDGFVNADPFGYWSSSQKGQLNVNNYMNGISSAHFQRFDNGVQGDTGLSEKRRVRAIRIF